MKVKYGAYDPLYPNGIVTVAGKKEIFGLRFLAADRDDHHLICERKLDFKSIRIRPNEIDRNMDFSWQVGGKTLHLSWCRAADDAVFGQLEFDEGLEVVAELYLPWESRLEEWEWVNFTRQGERVFAGELISPLCSYENNAILFSVDRAPDGALGYNRRTAQYKDFEQTGTLRNITSGDIWSDMGLSWYLGAHYKKGFSFVLKNGKSKDFFAELEKDENFLDGLFDTGRKILPHRPQGLTGTGMLAPIGEAFSSLLSYNTMYKPHTGRRYIMVDRTWVRCEDGWGVQFNWDTFLSSWSSSWTDPELAKENMLSGYDAQLPDGKIPLITGPGRNHAAEPPISAGRCQHIVQGLTLWNTYLHTGDKEWAKICYEGAKKHNAWWFADRGDGQKRRDALDIGLLGFGYDPEEEVGILGAKRQPYVAKAQYAYFETYDDSPQWTNGVFFNTVRGMDNVTEDDVTDEAKYIARYHMADIYTLERCCLYAVNCECLAKMAAVLGYPDDEAEFLEKYRRMAERINEKMWCEEDGCYYNLKFDGTLSKKQAPDCFMPFMTGLVPEDRKKRLLAILTDENKFWGEYMIPSIAKDDPAFPNQKYWRGQIWPPQVLWTYLGLKRIGEAKLAWEFAVKAGRMLQREWSERGYTPENYNGYTGRCSGAEHYNWGVLMGLPLLEELVSFREDKVIFGNLLAEDGTELRNIPVDGRRYDMKIENGVVSVYCDGSCVAKGRGTAEIARL